MSTVKRRPDANIQEAQDRLLAAIRVQLKDNLHVHKEEEEEFRRRMSFGILLARGDSYRGGVSKNKLYFHGKESDSLASSKTCRNTVCPRKVWSF